jgi:hypothetical protein
MTQDQYGALQQLRQQAPQQQQQQAGARQSQSQQQGGTPPEKTPRTTADPAADGQSVYDVQDDEARRERERHPLPSDRPDSNAI